MSKNPKLCQAKYCRNKHTGVQMFCGKHLVSGDNYSELAVADPSLKPQVDNHYKCPLCDAASKARVNMQQHLTDTHGFDEATAQQMTEPVGQQPSWGGGDAMPHPSQQDNHLNNELDKLLREEGYCYEHSDCGETMCLATAANEEAIKRILNIINQEKAKLIDRISKEVVGELEDPNAVTNKGIGYTRQAFGRNSLRAEQRTQLNRIKEGFNKGRV